MMQEAAAQNTVLLRLAQGIVVAATTEIPGGNRRWYRNQLIWMIPRGMPQKAMHLNLLRNMFPDEVWGIVWAGVVQTAGTTLPDSMKQLSRTNFLTTLNAPARVAEIETELWRTSPPSWPPPK